MDKLVEFLKAEFGDGNSCPPLRAPTIHLECVDVKCDVCWDTYIDELAAKIMKLFKSELL